MEDAQVHTKFKHDFLILTSKEKLSGKLAKATNDYRTMVIEPKKTHFHLYVEAETTKWEGDIAVRSATLE